MASSPPRAWTWGLLALGSLALSGCAQLGYYWQSIDGHVRLMAAARPVPDWLADAQTPEALKARLSLSQRIRDFAVSELHLPDNPSYRRYADLRRRAVVWNVVAAPPYSLTLKTWCFPVTGCVGYRGYFDEAQARALADGLARTEGLEVSVYGVPAYSTLGWMNWAGGDPLLNTFIHYPEGELARMIFHELAHQVVYVPDDTVFNESFASAVERLGAQRWLATQASVAVRAEYEAFDARRNAVRTLALATRQKLQRIYQDFEEKTPVSATTTTKFAIKNEAMAQFRADYAAMKARFSDPPAQWAAYDAWVAQANNASLGAQGAYDDLVEGFERIFERERRDWPRFYDAVQRLAALPPVERRQQLKHLMEQARV